MKKETQSIPRYVVMDTKTGEVAPKMSEFRTGRITRKNPFFLRTKARRSLMFLSYISMLILVLTVEVYLSNNISFFGNSFAKICMGVFNVLFLVITVTEWFEIDARLEAYSSLSERLNYWEDEYIAISKKYEKLKSEIEEPGRQ